jgi:hypothetical protein
MRVRVLELRLVGALLVVLWAVGAIAVVVAYRPGGPIDGLVAAAALLPAAIAAAGVVWPPLARGTHAAAAIGWLGVLTALLLVPALAGIVGNVAAGGRQTLLPSPEVAYGTLVPLALTCLFTGLGIARAILGETSLRRRRLVLGGALAVALTAVSAGTFGGAALANDLALRELPPRGASPLGPTDPSIVPPVCDGPLRAGRFAEVTIEGAGRIDGVDYGGFRLLGIRSGINERWEATRRTPWGSAAVAYVRVGASASYRESESAGWEVVPASATLDGAVVGIALGQEARTAAEDVGIEIVEGAKARHCRLAIDGPTALTAVPALRWLVKRNLFDQRAAAEVWRGEIDWWVFGDDELGMARLGVSGPPGGDWSLSGFQATITAELVARERGTPQPIEPPVGISRALAGAARLGRSLPG